MGGYTDGNQAPPPPPDPARQAGEGRYSPGECIGAEKKRVEGRPDLKHISTRFAERANLTVRMGNRRFTRLRNAFSKKAASKTKTSSS